MGKKELLIEDKNTVVPVMNTLQIIREGRGDLDMIRDLLSVQIDPSESMDISMGGHV